MQEFEDRISTYDNLSNKVKVLVQELLSINDIRFHTIESRVKNKQSLADKLSRKKGKYKNLDEITDLVGCRIITFFEDDVEKAVNVLRSEFTIDQENSIDKKEILDPDRFGYLSYHIVCSINEERTSLREYRRYKGLRFEIQVRSILQHAWAEIEHDVGYKSNIEIPVIMRRGFSRIAGLLEIADKEFCEFKRELETYKKSLENRSTLSGAAIDKESLTAYIRTSKIVAELNSYICKIGEYSLSNAPEYLEAEIPWLRKYNINTVSNLDKTLKTNKKGIKIFIEEWINNCIDEEEQESNESITIDSGISIFYLNYLLTAEFEDEEGVKRYFEERSLVPGYAQDNAGILIDIHSRIPNIALPADS